MSACQLCSSTTDLSERAVAPRSDTVKLCGVCWVQIDGEALDPKHWFCLQESIWSETPAVQVISYRMLSRLAVDHSWARDALDGAYLEDELLVWAREGLEEDSTVATVDSNGTVLADGDSVTLIKDLDVKGANFTAKRGTLVKNIRLSDDPGLVEGRVNKTAIFLKTEFLKKA